MLTDRLICIAGVDGSGKTTLAKKLVDELNQKGYPTKYVWFRFPYFLTFTLLFIARLTKLTQYVSNGKHRVGIHYFHLQPFRALYPLTVLIDTLVHYVIKIAIPLKLGYIVICDRWIYDIIVDVSIDVHNVCVRAFHPSAIGGLYYRLASQARFTLLLDAPDHVLETRRPETQLDPYKRGRRILYRRLAKAHGINTIYTENEIGIAFDILMSMLKEKLKLDFEQPNIKVYDRVKKPILRLFLKKKYFRLVANWFFQGMLISTWGERLFRLCLDILFASLVFTSFSSLATPSIPALFFSVIVAHTLNWTFNGNLWLNLKFYGGRYNKERNLEFLRSLNTKLKNGSSYVSAIAVFGSLSRGEFDETSDIDMKIIRRSGATGYIKANVFAFYLHSIAFIKKIPLELYVLDSVVQIKGQTRPDEPPVIIHDPNNVFSKIDARAIPLRNLAT